MLTNVQFAIDQISFTEKCETITSAVGAKTFSKETVMARQNIWGKGLSETDNGKIVVWKIRNRHPNKANEKENREITKVFYGSLG